MTKQDQQNLLGKTLWKIADTLRGSMDADDFRDYMLSFLFLRYLSDNYETEAKKELVAEYPSGIAIINADENITPLNIWYEQNPNDINDFENMMRRRIHYVI